LDKNYTKEFQKEIIKRHIIIAFISVIIILLFYFFIDHFYNGAVINFINDLFGYNFAHFILKNQKMVIFITLIIAILINSVLVEVYAIQKISQVFTSIRTLVQKDDQEIVLEDSLKELEHDLNVLKKESIENEKKAIREEQHKIDMIAYLAHDIKTPLASVIGYLCLLNETDLPHDLRKKYTEMTLDKAYRLEKLINEFFDIAKLSQAYQTLHKEEINLYYLLEQMKEEFYPLLTQHHQQLQIQVNQNILIYVDAQKMARVFNNIIKNAMYYGDENSIISIETKEDQIYTHILFKNQGPTIPQDKLDLIFEQFYRLDESRSSQTGGSGLGLSIAKMITKQHQGFIKVTSQNHITTFEVILPHKDTF
jgi:two-component system sensor histidine kinase VanS